MTFNALAMLQLRRDMKMDEAVRTLQWFKDQWSEISKYNNMTKRNYTTEQVYIIIKNWYVLTLRHSIYKCICYGFGWSIKFYEIFYDICNIKLVYCDLLID